MSKNLVIVESPAKAKTIVKECQEAFDAGYREVIFDEVQRVPELFSYLQTIVDEKKIMGQFILSGSQNFQLLNNISQSLAGRVALLKLLPFDFKELQSGKLLPKDYYKLMYTGFYPAIYDRGISPTTYYSNYVQTYIERDVLELTHIKDLKLFRNFWLRYATLVCNVI